MHHSRHNTQVTPTLLLSLAGERPQPTFPLLINKQSLKYRASKIVKSTSFAEKLRLIYEEGQSEEVIHHKMGQVELKLPRHGVTNQEGYLEKKIESSWRGTHHTKYVRASLSEFTFDYATQESDRERTIIRMADVEDVIVRIDELKGHCGFSLVMRHRNYLFQLPNKEGRDQKLTEWLEVFSGLFELRQLVLTCVQQPLKFPFLSLSQAEVEDISSIIGNCSLSFSDFTQKKRAVSMGQTIADVASYVIGAEFESSAYSSSQVGIAPEEEIIDTYDHYQTQSRKQKVKKKQRKAKTRAPSESRDELEDEHRESRVEEQKPAVAMNPAYFPPADISVEPTGCLDELSERSDLRSMSLLSQLEPVGNLLQLRNQQARGASEYNRIDRRRETISRPSQRGAQSIDFKLTQYEESNLQEEEIEESVTSSAFDLKSRESSIIDPRPPAARNLGWLQEVNLDETSSRRESVQTASDLNYSISDRQSVNFRRTTRKKTLKQPVPIAEEKEDEEICFPQIRKESILGQTRTTAPSSRDSKLVEESHGFENKSPEQYREEPQLLPRRASDDDDLQFMEGINKIYEDQVTPVQPVETSAQVLNLGALPEEQSEETRALINDLFYHEKEINPFAKAKESEQQRSRAPEVEVVPTGQFGLPPNLELDVPIVQPGMRTIDATSPTPQGSKKLRAKFMRCKSANLRTIDQPGEVPEQKKDRCLSPHAPVDPKILLQRFSMNPTTLTKKVRLNRSNIRQDEDNISQTTQKRLVIRRQNSPSFGASQPFKPKKLKIKVNRRS